MSILFSSEVNAHPTKVERTVDHLLLGASDLERAVAWVEHKTGVKALTGGSHPGVGTRNALISLSSKRYLEIIAPDPNQPGFTFKIDIRKLSEPRLITWAAFAADIEKTRKLAQEAGCRPFGPHDGSRATPDGTMLRWKTLGIANAFGGDGVEPIPFFIRWADGSPHPSQDAPGGCDLQTLAFMHPDPERLVDQLGKLGIGATAKRASKVSLVAALNTPKGRIELS